MDIGQAIRTLRQRQNMTQGQLAERCGFSVNQVSSWEIGKAYPPKGTVERICSELGVPTSYLFLAGIEATDIPEEKRVLYQAMIEPLRNELLETNNGDEQRI